MSSYFARLKPSITIMSEMDVHAASGQRLRGRVLKWCALLALAFTLLILVLFALHDIQRRQRRHRVQESFVDVLIAFHSYEQIMRHLPPPNVTDSSGLPIASWRFAIYWALTSPGGVNYIGPVNAFDEAWTSPTYSWMMDRIPRCYSLSEDAAVPFTRILAIVGPGTAFEAGRLRSRAELDGDTILIVEVKHSGLHWMEPGDLDVRMMPRSINHPSGKGIAGINPEEFHVGFADGQVWCLRSNISFEDIEKFFTVEGAKQFDREEVLGPHRVSRYTLPL
jgi:hypothetical protein